MANPTETINEAGFLTSTPALAFARTVAEAGIVSDAQTLARAITVLESLHGSVALSYVRVDSIFESAVLSEVYTQIGQPFENVLDKARFSDATFATRSYMVNEAERGVDAALYHLASIVSELGRVADTWTPVRLFKVLVIETAKASDALSYVRALSVNESGHLSDAPLATRSVAVQESGVLADAEFPGGVRLMTIEENGTVADTLTQLLLATMTVQEEGFADACPIMPDDSAAWTANTDSWGMSRYTGLGFNSIAPIDGVLFAAGDLGLYRLDADDNSGMPIAAGIDTEVTDHGSAQEKRMGYLYAGAKTIGTLLWLATGMEGGKPITYSYAFDARITGSGYGSTRAKAGKGPKTRYWQHGIRNKDGADFRLDDVLVVFDLTGRKV